MGKPKIDTRLISKIKHVSFKNTNSKRVDSLATSSTNATLRKDPNSKQLISTSIDKISINHDPISNEESHVENPNPKKITNGKPIVVDEEAHVKHNQDAVNFQLAIYIAMAHAGLILAMSICYGMGLLLREYWTPIQWAVLISMPLHRVQGVVVDFWRQKLDRGIFETIFAIPITLFCAVLETTKDLYKSIFNREISTDEADVTFSKLCDWLFTLGTFTLLYESLGILYTIIIICISYAIYKSFNEVFLVIVTSFDQKHHNTTRLLNFTRWGYQRLAQTLTIYLPPLVAIGLIVLMILVVIGGIILFSFEVGVEAKDAALAFKLKIESNKLEAPLGLSNWIEPKSIESNMMAAYAIVVQKVDEYAKQKNMTIVIDSAKELFNSITSNDTTIITGAKPETLSIWNRLMIIYQVLKEKFKKRELSQALRNLMKSGEGFIMGSFYVLIIYGTIVANFIKQLIVFVFVLFYLITSERGGVMEQALQVIPLSRSTRVRCATVLDRTISVVLLTTGKLMFFQASFTYLFCRLLEVHFLYLSTCIALVQAVMPVFPNWIASLPAMLQFIAQNKYIHGVCITLFYRSVMNYGNIKIQGVVSNYNQYLTGLSIAGGMALFQPAISGIIIGPLVLTVLIAIRELYSEFVLKAFSYYQEI